MENFVNFLPPIQWCVDCVLNVRSMSITHNSQGYVVDTINWTHVSNHYLNFLHTFFIAIKKVWKFVWKFEVFFGVVSCVIWRQTGEDYKNL